MTDQEYSQAVANFTSALTLFTERIEGLTKPPLEVPQINEQSDDSEKRDALRRMLNSLASTDDKAVLSGDDILKTANFFAKLYGGDEPYRHRYADICELIFDKLDQTREELDDGVPTRSTASPRTSASSTPSSWSKSTTIKRKACSSSPTT